MAACAGCGGRQVAVGEGWVVGTQRAWPPMVFVYRKGDEKGMRNLIEDIGSPLHDCFLTGFDSSNQLSRVSEILFQIVRLWNSR